MRSDFVKYHAQLAPQSLPSQSQKLRYPRFSGCFKDVLLTTAEVPWHPVQVIGVLQVFLKTSEWFVKVTEWEKSGNSKNKHETCAI